MQNSNIMLSFTGNINDDLLGSILHIIEEKLNKSGEVSSVKKKIYNILIECLQNLLHHIDEMPVLDDDFGNSKNKNAIFMIGKSDQGYKIITGNYISNSEINPLKERIEKINSMDEAGLKQYFLSILNVGQLSEKGGGGLGLIDIARRSKNKLDYDFLQINDKHSFFTLGINITAN